MLSTFNASIEQTPWFSAIVVVTFSTASLRLRASCALNSESRSTALRLFFEPLTLAATRRCKRARCSRSPTVARGSAYFSPVLSTTGGTSDGRFIARLCPQVMEFGVVGESIHKIDEWVEVAAVEPLTQIYRRTIENFLR